MALRSRRPRHPGHRHRASRPLRHGRRDPAAHPPALLVRLGPRRKVNCIVLFYGCNIFYPSATHEFIHIQP